MFNDVLTDVLTNMLLSRHNVLRVNDPSLFASVSAMKFLNIGHTRLSVLIRQLATSGLATVSVAGAR